MAIIFDDLNNRSYGGLYVSSGGGTQNTDATPGVYTKITQFATAGAASALVVPSVANNNIKTNKSGLWLCMFHVAFDPGDSSTFTFRIYAGVSGAETARVNVTSQAKVGAAADITDVSSAGFITLNTYDVVDLRVACSGANKAVAVKEANLILARFSSV